METLQYYLSCFAGMNCNKLRGQVAPHKAMMLIAVMDEVACGHITNGFVPLNDVMVRSFESAWQRYVGAGGVFHPVFATPFYHLGNEPFWELMKSNQHVVRKEYSLSALRQSFFGAKLPDDLMCYMQDAASRQLLKRVLLEKYVPNRTEIEATQLVAEGQIEYIPNKNSRDIRMTA